MNWKRRRERYLTEHLSRLDKSGVGLVALEKQQAEERARVEVAHKKEEKRMKALEDAKRKSDAARAREQYIETATRSGPCDECAGCGHLCKECKHAVSACECDLDTEEMRECYYCNGTGERWNGLTGSKGTA